MDPIDTTVTIADWLSNSYLRSVVITCFIAGGAVGFLLSNHAFAFLRWYIEWKRKTKQEDETEQRRAAEEAAAKEREARIAELKKSLKYDPDGNLYDSQGNFYCPQCLHERLRLVVVERPFEKTIHCPECNFRQYFGPLIY